MLPLKGADEDRGDHDHASAGVGEVDESHLEVVFLDYAEAAKQQRPSRQQVNKSKHLLASSRLNCKHDDLIFINCMIM